MRRSFLILLAVCACDPQMPSRLVDRRSNLSTTEVEVVTPEEMTGRARTFAFPLNGAATLRITDPVTQVLATLSESFVTFRGTNAVLAWSSIEAPQAKAARPSSRKEHDGAARSYFTTRLGISDAEIGETIGYVGYRGGQSTAGERPSDEFIGYSTSFVRRIAGYEVVDSVASVELTRTGIPVNLSFHWPVLDAGAVDLAAQLQRSVDRGWVAPSNVGGRTIKRTRAVIHHSAAEAGSIQWAAAIRVEYGGQGSRQSFEDFDERGERVDWYFSDAAPGKK